MGLNIATTKKLREIKKGESIPSKVFPKDKPNKYKYTSKKYMRSIFSKENSNCYMEIRGE